MIIPVLVAQKTHTTRCSAKRLAMSKLEGKLMEHANISVSLPFISAKSGDFAEKRFTHPTQLRERRLAM